MEDNMMNEMDLDLVEGAQEGSSGFGKLLVGTVVLGLMALTAVGIKKYVDKKHADKKEYEAAVMAGPVVEDDFVDAEESE